MAQQQGLYWILTIPHDKWEKPTTLPEWANCLMGQLEIGETGFRHWQLLVALKRKTKLGGVKKLFCQQAHCELSRSAAANDYVCKEETAVEGTRFKMGFFPLKRGDKEDWDKIKQLAQEGRLNELPADIYCRYYNSMRNIAMDNSPMPANLSGCCGVWIWGPPGVGKSHMAREKFGCNYDKMPNKWWDGYKDGQVPMLDDFGHSHVKLIDYIKRWSDMYPFKSEIKGSSKYLRPRLFVITSNYSIETLFPDTYEQSILKDRFKIIHIPMKMHNLAKRPHVLDDVPADIPRSPVVKKTIIDLTADTDEEDLPDWQALGFIPTGLLAPETDEEDLMPKRKIE